MHLYEAKFADDAASPFAIETIATQDPDLPIAPGIHGRKDAAMPE
jgi:hypothetical protein